MLEVVAQLLRILKLAIGHIAPFFELAQERSLDRGMFPYREKNRRFRRGKDVIGDLECSALAHSRSNIKEGVGAAELTQPVAAEIHRVERQPLALLKVLPERLVGQRCFAGEVFER